MSLHGVLWSVREGHLSANEVLAFLVKHCHPVTKLRRKVLNKARCALWCGGR